jgi:NAD(P)-dependent dehydrogenase (short-subunit alcohol dehydrogenase family)
LARRVRAFAVHPGVIYTELGRHLSAARANSPGVAARQQQLEFETVPQGAATSCWAATLSELDGMGG